MTILALEFSSDRRSVAVARDGALLSEAEASGGRATNAFGLIEQALAGSRTRREEIQTIAVGLGPGSYTGIRAAIAVAQGWQLAREIRLLGVSSVAAIAVSAQAEKRFGRLNLIVDAQRGEFYLATWEISAKQRREIAALTIVRATEIERREREGEMMAGPAAAAPQNILFPTASAVACLAAGLNHIVPGEKLVPIYLRETSFVKALPPRM